jgi:hypothetical protein
MKELRKVSDIIDDEDYFDGILFRLTSISDKEMVWKIITIDFTDKGRVLPDYEKSKFGYDKYRIVYFNQDGSTDYIECVLFDPKTYIKSLLDIEQEAMVVRCCKQSADMIRSFYVKRLKNTLRYIFDEYAEENYV